MKIKGFPVFLIVPALTLIWASACTETLNPNLKAAAKAAKILQRKNDDSFKLVSAYVVDNPRLNSGPGEIQAVCLEFWKNKPPLQERLGVVIPPNWDGEESTLSSGEFLFGALGADSARPAARFTAECRGQIVRQYLTAEVINVID